MKEEDGRGVPLTTSIEIPFVPQSGLILIGSPLEQDPIPPGLMIDEVGWEMDRQVFLITLKDSLFHDFPIATIPDEIERWKDAGWKLGSWENRYEQEFDDDEENDQAATQPSVDDEWEDLESLSIMSRRKQPKEFRQLIRALVKVMAEGYNNLAVAYAMDKTGKYFTEDQVKAATDPWADRWESTSREYEKLSQEAQFAWMRTVKNYRSRLDKLSAVSAPSTEPSR